MASRTGDNAGMARTEDAFMDPEPLQTRPEVLLDGRFDRLLDRLLDLAALLVFELARSVDLAHDFELWRATPHCIVTGCV
jgi:hypothetical protein